MGGVKDMLTYSQHQLYMKASSKLHAPTALPPEEKAAVSMEYETG
jgi:hypothetical protein